MGYRPNADKGDRCAEPVTYELRYRAIRGGGGRRLPESLFLFALVHVWRCAGTLVAPAAAKRRARARLSPAAAEKFFRLATQIGRQNCSGLLCDRRRKRHFRQ